MKQIVNFVIAGVVLWLAARWFPEVIQIDGFKTLIITTLLLFLAEAVVVIALFVMMIFSLFAFDWYAIFGAIIGIFFAEIFALSLLDAWIPGFHIIGFMPKMMLALALSIFRIPDNQNNN